MAMFNTAVIENGMAYNTMNTNLKYIIAVPAPNFTSKSTMQYIFCWYSSQSVVRRVGVWTLIAITHITRITNTQVLVVIDARNGNYTASERSKVIATIVRTETMVDISTRNGNIRQNIMPSKSLKSHLYPNNKIIMTLGRYTSVKIESLIAMFAIKKLIVFLIALFLNSTAKTRKLPVMAKNAIGANGATRKARTTFVSWMKQSASCTSVSFEVEFE